MEFYVTFRVTKTYELGTTLQVDKPSQLVSELGDIKDEDILANLDEKQLISTEVSISRVRSTEEEMADA